MKMNELVAELRRPLFVYTMARPMIGRKSGAEARVENASREIDALLTRYVRERLDDATPCGSATQLLRQMAWLYDADESINGPGDSTLRTWVKILRGRGE